MISECNIFSCWFASSLLISQPRLSLGEGTKQLFTVWGAVVQNDVLLLIEAKTSSCGNSQLFFAFQSKVEGMHIA